MIKRLRKYIFGIVIYLLWIAAVFDPIGEFFMLRYLALTGAIGCLVLSGIYLRLFIPNTSTRVIIIYISFLMPVYGFMLYVMRGGYVSELIDTSYIAAGILLLTALIYENEDLCRYGIRAMTLSLRLLAFTIISIYATTAFEVNNDAWISFFTERNTALVSIREYAGITLPYIYFLASPMLIYLIAYDLNKLFTDFGINRVLICFSSIFALALSGTRAHILIALAFPLLFYVLTYARHKLMIIFFSIFSVGFSVNLFDFEILGAFFSTNETSNAMKYDMLGTYAGIFNDPITFIFGQGYNAHAWSLPLREIISMEENASKTELTYIEIVRVYGLLMSIPLFFIFIFTIHQLSRISNEYRWLYSAFIIYMLNSSFNPYLFSTNGILPLALILAVVSLKSRYISTRNFFHLKTYLSCNDLQPPTVSGADRMRGGQ